MKIFFYIITVSYNAGDALIRTYESVAAQNYPDALMLVQDGGSTDGSLEALEKRISDEADTAGSESADGGKKISVSLVCEKDKGIYDAMNKATERAVNDKKTRFKASDRVSCYVSFMNCGDFFYDGGVLKKAAERIEKITERMSVRMQLAPKAFRPGICYGDTFDRSKNEMIKAPFPLDDFACYRALPCHQSCFYDLDLLEKEKYDISYKVRADYEHFLRLKYKGHADIRYLKMTVADYRGGGFSETDENKKRSEEERKKIISLYLPRSKVMKYDFYRAATLQPLREKLSRNKYTAGAYNKLRNMFIGSDANKE